MHNIRNSFNAIKNTNDEDTNNMKIIHTADWHLGDSFHGYDRIEEHEHFFGWLKGIIADERPDALLIAGDVFDNANPSAQAEEMFYRFLAQATALHPGMRIIITAGNHDSGRRLQAPAELLRPMGVEIRGVIKHDEQNQPLTDDLIIPIGTVGSSEVEAIVLAVPYLRMGDIALRDTLSNSVREFFIDLVSKVRKAYGRDIPVVLMAHLYTAGAEIAQNEHSERLVVGGEDCLDIHSLDVGANYVALGHIHKAQAVGGRDKTAYYAGSPMPMSFAEKNYSHGVNIITFGDNNRAVVDRLAYQPLRAIKSVPDNGGATLHDVLEQLRSLPKADKVSPSQWPYIEVKLSENTLTPTAQGDISTALQDKAVRLCRVIRIVPDTIAESKRRKMHSLDQLRNISPLDIAHDAYLAAKGCEMNEELVKRFQQVVKIVNSTNNQ